MKAVHTTLTNYQSVDGKLFSSKEACAAHEESMGRYDYYICAYPHTFSDKDNQIGLYIFGYTTTSSYTEQVQGGFLREAGEVTHYNDHYHDLGHVLANREEALHYALTNENFWSKHYCSYIRRVNFTDLSDRCR